MTGLTYFCSAVDILYVEDTAEAVEQHLGEGRHQLGGGHQHIDTRRPGTTQAHQCHCGAHHCHICCLLLNGKVHVHIPSSDLFLNNS